MYCVCLNVYCNVLVLSLCTCMFFHGFLNIVIHCYVVCVCRYHHVLLGIIVMHCYVLLCIAMYGYVLLMYGYVLLCVFL